FGKEQELAEPCPLEALEVLGRDDLVGIDVGLVVGSGEPLFLLERSHALLHALMSTKCPSMAAAAAMAGLTRCVRPPGPWRPSKLRLEVEAQRSPGPSTSGFIPRHIEQPASRHSNPASRKTRSSPSASAAAFT